MPASLSGTSEMLCLFAGQEVYVPVRVSEVGAALLESGAPVHTGKVTVLDCMVEPCLEGRADGVAALLSILVVLLGEQLIRECFTSSRVRNG